MLKIEVEPLNAGVLIRLTGRIESGHIDMLTRRMAGISERISLNLADVTMVDLPTVRFLLSCEDNGIELRSCSRFIREWIERERGSRAD